MLPFGEESSRRRNINLGGATLQHSHTALLDRARALRNARREDKRREDAAVKIQRWLRSQRKIHTVRRGLRGQFDLGLEAIKLPQGQNYLTWTRLLLLSGPDNDRLFRWAKETLTHRGDILLGLLHGAQGMSWLTLMSQVSHLLFSHISQDINSEASQLYLSILAILLCPNSALKDSNGISLEASSHITVYLARRDLFILLGKAMEQIPPTSKTALKSSIYLSQILAAIFPNLSRARITAEVKEKDYTMAQLHFLQYILTISLLPNRIPLKELPRVVTQIPWDHLPFIPSHAPRISGLPLSLTAFIFQIESSLRPHVLANLVAFLSPRYSILPISTLSGYLELYSEILNAMESNQLEQASLPSEALSGSSVMKHIDTSDSGDDIMEDMSFPSKASSTHHTVPNAVDTRTMMRLNSMVSQTSISSLLGATSRSASARSQLFRLMLALVVSYPSRRDQIWTAVSVSQSGGSGLVRECWRNYVRSSALGKVEDETATKVLMDPSYATLWPSLLFLVSLYTHSLLTIGDDEFFSLSTSPSALRNPLSTDDLVAFSRQLLHIAFPLYWYDDQTKVKNTGPVGVKMTWEKVRELVSACLKGIHARDSRRPFAPPGHWLITSQVDLHSFVEAAVLEEHSLADEDSVTMTTPSRHSRNGLSARQIAQISPRLGVLNNIPFSIPFEVRVEIFRHFVNNDFNRTFQQGERTELISIRRMFDVHFNRPIRKRATVRRGHIAQDGFDQLSGLGPELKGPVEIQFIDQFGQEEAGIDGGGVFKEFLTSLSREVFDANKGLWLTTQQQELYPNPHSYATEPHQLNWYRFIGRILGKALYEGILVDVAFAPFFLAKWLGKQSYLDDLGSLDPELYNGLIFLKHYDKDFEDLSLNFTITEDDLGTSRTIDLIPHGDQISVTKQNRLQYIYLVSHYRLSKQIKRQSDAFFEGLSDIINPRWLRMFNQQEVQILVGGVNAPIDVGDLQRNCNYGGLYDENHETIHLFWKVLSSFNQEQRRGLLRFVTSCSRPPLLGFKELYPKFSIRDSSSDEQRLPTSSTCVNLLKLPRYQTEKTMREKLLQAIYSGAGFDLS